MLEDEFGFQHERLKVLKGGIQGWKQAGYPIEITTAARPMGKRLTLWGRIKVSQS